MKDELKKLEFYMVLGFLIFFSFIFYIAPKSSVTHTNLKMKILSTEKARKFNVLGGIAGSAYRGLLGGTIMGALLSKDECSIPAIFENKPILVAAALKDCDKIKADDIISVRKTELIRKWQNGDIATKEVYYNLERN